MGKGVIMKRVEVSLQSYFGVNISKWKLQSLFLPLPSCYLDLTRFSKTFRFIPEVKTELTRMSIKGQYLIIAICSGKVLLKAF